MSEATFEEKGMIAIITISGTTGLFLHFAYDVPWFSAGSVPAHVVGLIGVGLPLLFACAACMARKETYSQYDAKTFPKDSFKNSKSIHKNTQEVSPPKHSRSFDSEAAFNKIPYLGEFEAEGRLEPTDEDLTRIKLMERRMKESFTIEMFEALEIWAKYFKGLRALLLQFSRARPGRRGVSDIEECFELLSKASKWRHAHRLPLIFKRGYDVDHRIELKQRFLNSFFYGRAVEVGDPIYYNCMGQADMNHTDLVPGKFSINDLSVCWLQEMEYREKVLFPSHTKAHGKLVNYMYVVFDAKDASMGRLKLLSYLKPTAGLNSEYYPESVRQILVVNAPSIVSWLFSFVKPLMPETTQKKVVFISGNGHEELFALTKDEKMIPKEYGGKGPSRHEIVVNFQNELNEYLKQEPDYDTSPNSQAKDRKLRNAFQNLAEKDTK
mmetsp:Transcript_40216/g.51794  ORF Transcript_40216/g.51794 Transcript_40216/m.51794 type:complete len:438 (+) Transcript_40216:122-1435(+)|eukprot:CAMPEP_0114335790 /NCGR_PEP_ID=MMETSP0101-20121206/5282_1 /TAXON_ID=38822 ORGANISM="Pteridomonas danica, Strain PT" /NCGR_SAMPLE_ID=MMETSP0101 /ASSEMBLY_ACC=CAM_ASM_000211 /LENGTH=437 /DNA_ID=CAMNT_0001467511 /DNA_START=120 /DNA_END=1433 /DNA_ORIENTATION=+